jgi:chaperonin GroES
MTEKQETPQAKFEREMPEMAARASRLEMQGVLILVAQLPADTITSGGIVIPDSAKERPKEGLVLAIGDGAREDGKIIALRMKVGDRVFFPANSGKAVWRELDELVVMNAGAVLAIVKPEKGYTEDFFKGKEAGE